MKKLLFIIIMALITPFAMSQPGSRHHGQHQPTPPHQPTAPAEQDCWQPVQTAPHYTLTFAAEHGEEFMVYVDGDIVNRKPSPIVIVPNLSHQTHDIYVVLKRPMDKITMVKFHPNMTIDKYVVSYNVKDGMLRLLPMQPVPTVSPVQPPHVCTFEEVERMYTALKNESFDETRSSMAKNMVANNKMAAHQIKRLAESFSFDNNKLSFLKYAYDYCIDRQNYYECVDVLSFSSDKEALLRYINN